MDTIVLKAHRESDGGKLLHVSLLWSLVALGVLGSLMPLHSFPCQQQAWWQQGCGLGAEHCSIWRTSITYPSSACLVTALLENPSVRSGYNGVLQYRIK